MPFLLTGFREAFPHIKILLDEGSSLDMIHSLVDLKNEVVIIAKAEENPDISFIPFSREELVLILSPDHPLAGKSIIEFEHLAQEPIIMKDPGSGTRTLVDELFAQHTCTPKILMETGDAEIIKLLVQYGEGISFLVREAVAVELQEGKLVTVPLKDQNIFLDVSIAYLKKQPLSPPAQAFLRSLENLGTKEMRFKGMGALMKKMLVQQG
jgi:DNA-binding transcriptional LysR family regulator